MYVFTVRTNAHEATRQIANKFKEQRLRRPVINALIVFGKRFMSKLIANTPVDTTPERDNIVAKQEWSWTTTQQSIKIKNSVPYAVFLEFGSRQGYKPWPHVGPRTTFGYSQWDYETTGARGVFVMSSQAPYGMVQPSFDQIGGYETIDKLIKQEIKKSL